MWIIQYQCFRKLSPLTIRLLHFYLYSLQDLDAEAIVKIVNEFDDPADAARKLVKTSAALWAEKNDYCDDITAIVIFIQEEKQEKLSRGSMFRRIQKQFPLLSSVSSRRFVKRMQRRKQSAVVKRAMKVIGT